MGVFLGHDLPREGGEEVLDDGLVGAQRVLEVTEGLSVLGRGRRGSGKDRSDMVEPPEAGESGAVERREVGGRHR